MLCVAGRDGCRGTHANGRRVWRRRRAADHASGEPTVRTERCRRGPERLPALALPPARSVGSAGQEAAGGCVQPRPHRRQTNHRLRPRPPGGG